MSGDREPSELRLLDAVKQFGVRAVMGRDTLSAGEIARARYADFIVNAYRLRAAAENWAEFAKAYPNSAAALTEAERLANGE